MNQCINCFTDYIVKCQDHIQVNAKLEPTTEYIWVIIDKFSRQYRGAFTTDAEGFWQIPITDLPAGLLTEFSGEFTLQVFTSDDACAPEKFKIAQVTDCLIFSVAAGTREKNNLGCIF